MKIITKTFLEHAKKECNLVSVFLSTGVKLQGNVIDFDEDSILFSCPKDDNQIVILLQYITTISRKTAKTNNHVHHGSCSHNE